MDSPVKNYILCGLKVEKDPFTGEINILTGTVKETPTCGGGSPGVSPGVGAGAGAGAPPPPPTTGTTLETDPRFAKYDRLIHTIKMPIQAVKLKLTRERDTIHETYIDLISTARDTPAPPEGTDLSQPYTPGGGSSSTSATTSTAPIKQGYIEPISSYATYTKLTEADIKKIIPSLNELKKERDNNPYASNITEVKEIVKKVDALIKTALHDIIQPLIDILIAIPDSGPLKGKEQAAAKDAVENLKKKIAIYPTADNINSAKEQIRRVDGMLPNQGSVATAAVAGRQQMILKKAMKVSVTYTEEKVNSDINGAASAANALRIAIRENPLAPNKSAAESELDRINGFINAAPGGPVAAAAAAAAAAPRKGGRRTRNYRIHNHRRSNTRRSKH